MNSKSAFCDFISLALTIVFLSMGPESFTQDEIARASIQNDELSLIIPKASLKQTLADTALPTLCNSGKGLMQIESISLLDVKNDHSSNITGDENPTAIQDKGFTELEMKDLQKQKRKIQEQFINEWHKQIRKERLELGLGEVIKGFYQKPLF